MPRSKAAVKAPEPTEPTTQAFVNGEVVEVPVSAIIFDPGAFGDPRDAFTADGALFHVRRGTLNPCFIPRLFPRSDGRFAILGVIRRLCHGTQTSTVKPIASVCAHGAKIILKQERFRLPSNAQEQKGFHSP